MIRTSYDPDADALHARSAPDGAEVARTDEVAPGVMLDLDADGDVVAVEVLSASRRGRGVAARSAAEPRVAPAGARAAAAE